MSVTDAIRSLRDCEYGTFFDILPIITKMQVTIHSQRLQLDEEFNTLSPRVKARKKFGFLPRVHNPTPQHSSFGKRFLSDFQWCSQKRRTTRYSGRWEGEHLEQGEED